MRRPLLSFCLSAAAAFSLGVSAAQAATVLGSHVESSTFAAAIGSTTGWSYLGQSTTAFSGTGTATLAYRSADWSDSFGFARTDYTGANEVFSPSDPVGSSASVAGYAPDYLLYFQAADGFLTFIDGNRQYTDGTDQGGALAQQGDIDIFRNGSMYALFYDDGGGALLPDDGDYDDLVVSYQVPEPGSLALLGIALAGWCATRRRKAA